ncbi:MAG: ester cyclase [Caldilineaceae bacterium]
MKRSTQLLGRVVFVGLVVALMAGLGIAAQTTPAAGMPPSANQAVVEAYFNDVLGKADAAAAATVLAPGFQRTDRSQDGVTLGAPGVMFLANYERQAFPDLRYTIDDLIVEGDHVAVCWTAAGTQAGAYGTAAATGKPVTWTGMSFFELKDGKIAGEEANLETPSAVLSTKDLRISPSYTQ